MIINESDPYIMHSGPDSPFRSLADDMQPAPGAC